MTNKNRIILISLFVLILILIGLISLFVRTNPTNEINPPLSPTITKVPIIKTIPSLLPTITLSAEDLKNIQIQQQADISFGKWQEETKASYSWYDKLPLQTDKYFVYFDLEEKKFIGQIYIKEEAEPIKAEILKILKEYGIEVEKHEFNWEIK